MEPNATTIDDTTHVDLAKTNAKKRHKRQRHNRNRSLAAPLRRFWVNLLTRLSVVERDLSDTSADSTFGSNSDEEHDEHKRKRQMGCRSSKQVHDARFRNRNESNGANDREYVDTLGFYDEEFAETIEDDIHIRIDSNNSYAGVKIIDSIDNNDDDSILQQTASIETEYVRPSAACCYCAETVPKSPRRIPLAAKKEKKTSQVRIEQNKANEKSFRHNAWNRVEMESMLSEDEKDGSAKEVITVQDNASPRYDSSVKEYEARFMAELESSHNEHFNVENSHWKKGFDFVRS